MTAKKLSAYPTTLEADKALLSANDAAASSDKTLTYNTRNCVLFRITEKKILNYYINTAINLIELSNYMIFS